MPECGFGRSTVRVIAALCVMAGCASGASTTIQPDVTEPEAQEVVSDPMRPPPSTEFPRSYEVVAASEKRPRGLSPGFDILHGTADLTFDYDVPSALGELTYVLNVQRNGLSEIRLRAGNLLVEAVGLKREGADLRSQFRTDGSWLVVSPEAPLARADTISLVIRYHAAGNPEHMSGGIRFIDPAGDDPSLPTQVWCCDTLERGSWLPEPDNPGELMTFDLRLTVHDSLTTVAAGEMVDQYLLDSGYRVDVWSVQVPQTPARIGFAVGRFLLVGDDYVSPVGKRSQLIFAVEPDQEQLVDATFAPTRDMMGVVERRTAVEYPYSDYKQVIVSGHTRQPTRLAGLALFGDLTLRDDRALLDGSEDGEIMRAVASQWFGSWVGVADQTQLPLIHGFARLFQAFYGEEVAGRLGLEEDLLRARHRYLERARAVRRPIIGVDAPDDVDAGVAEKSALALYQLSAVIGDELWWRAVRDFTARGGWRAVTIDDLRESMEQASRRNLTEYFDQWFFESGHPELVVEHDYDAQLGLFTLRIRQMQDPAAFPTFDIETSISIHFETAPRYRERIRIVSRDTTLRFGVPGRIAFARLDDDDRLVADIRERKPLEHWLNQAASDETVGGRYDAIEYLATGAPSDQRRDALMQAAAEDSSSVVRARAISGLAPYMRSGLVLRFLFDRAVTDPEAVCRVAAIHTLDEAGDPSAVSVYRSALEDPSYAVVAAAVTALGRATPATFWRTVEPVTETRSWNSVVERAILEVLAEAPDAQSEPYLEKLLEPHNAAGVRVAALNTFRQLSLLGREWETGVKSLAQSLLSDRNAEVRRQAREILEDL